MAIRKSLLPSAYQQVEYIESSGTQYIDTQVKPTTSMSSKIKLSFNSLKGSEGSDGQVLGCRVDNYRCYLLYTEAGTYWGYGKGGYYYASTPLPQINTIYNVETILGSTNQNMILDGVSIKTSSDSTDISAIDYNLYLFAFNFVGVAQRFTSIKLYSCSIYSNGTLVRNFIPCNRKSDSVIGLYDTVNGVFYTNAGSGDFTKGNDVMPKVNHIYKGSTKVIKEYKGTNLVFADVPSTFQRVEYIESSGTQYIDSGFVPSNTSGAKIKFYKTNNTDLMYFGVREQTNTNSRWSIGTTSTLYCGFNDITYFELNGSRPTLNSNEIYNVEFNYKNDRKLKLNGDVGDNDLTNITLTSITKNAYIFAANWGGTPNYFQSCRLYNLIFTDNETIVRNFIPCYRKADDVIGLYDLVNGVFYTNAGSGTFTKGNDVVPQVKHIIKPMALPNTYQRVEYIESTGTQYIDSGFNAQNGFKIQIDILFNDLSNNSSIFGLNGNSGECFLRAQTTTGYSFWANARGGDYTNFAFSINTKYNIECEFNSYGTAKVNGTQIIQLSTTKSYINNTVPLLAVYFAQNTTPMAISKAKLYKCYMYDDNGNLVRNFIPCYRKADNVVGLYDLVNNVFYTNQGTGTFNVGSDISNAQRIIKQYKGTSLYFYDVPSIYQRVEYIEATGTQYINTGIETSNNSWVLECVFKRASTMNGTIFGATGGFEVYLESSQPNYKALGITSSVQADVNTFNTIRLNPLPVAGGVVVLNVDGSSNSTSGQTYSFGNTIGLCGRGDGTRLIAGSFGEFKVSRGSTTLIHLLPCYRKTDNVVGMYDVISGQFFTNNGTGTFGKGADL